MSSWEQRGQYKRPRLLLQRHGHFDWQDWVIYAVVVAIALIVMVTYLPYRLDEAARCGSATAGCKAPAPPGHSHELKVVWSSDQYQQPAFSLIIRSPSNGCNCHSSTPKFVVKGRSC